MLVLGIESSCDETAVALVRGDRCIMAQRIASQDESHRPFGGVVPELAARAHAERLTPMVADVLDEAGIKLADVDAVAATAGPGLIGGVMVGLVTGKALAWAAGKPLLAINHLEGHALSPRLADAQLEFPYLLLLVSGGHCQLLGVDGVGRYRRLATTIDDAIGEAFDKTAKILGLGFPGGPAVERAARFGDARRFGLPRPLIGSDEPHFSFAGLKSAVLRQWRALETAFPDRDAQDRNDLAAGFQAAATDCLIDRTRKAMAAFPEATTLVVAGGVASNQYIRSALATLAATRELAFVAPPPWLCTDNAAMIAWAGAERMALSVNERLALGLIDGLDAPARPRWPLDPGAEAVRGAGVRA
jgi:N6-L-threonylcarbamoyladenine synthase